MIAAEVVSNSQVPCDIIPMGLGGIVCIGSGISSQLPGNHVELHVPWPISATLFEFPYRSPRTKPGPHVRSIVGVLPKHLPCEPIVVELEQ
jgi:hypothetical protein